MTGCPLFGVGSLARASLVLPCCPDPERDASILPALQLAGSVLALVEVITMDADAGWRQVRQPPGRAPPIPAVPPPVPLKPVLPPSTPVVLVAPPVIRAIRPVMVLVGMGWLTLARTTCWPAVRPWVIWV
jgi:hypothetical protein